MNSDPSKILTDLVQELSMATTIEGITRSVAFAAREIAGADGTSFVLREGQLCYYADENAISPLWKGSRFPLSTCISGWAMLNKTSVVIPDIYVDGRIPQDVYRPTFVKSLCMVPIRPEEPIGAIGSYWASGYCPNDEEIKFLQIIANSTAIALSNLELKKNLIESNDLRDTLIDREKDLEAALHTLAHDLRNPLSTMLLMSEALETKYGQNFTGNAQKYFKTIQKTGTQINEQIKRMLSLYGITQHKMSPERIDLSNMAQKIASDLIDKFPNRKIDFQIDSGLVAMADEFLLQVVLENLMSNAVKYTGKKEKAVVEFQHAGMKNGLSSFMIKDNGDGFDPHQAKMLFRPLVRLHENREFQGTGLGLASVARIIEMHGGTIHAEGKKSIGATFYFDLPIAH